MAIQAKSLQSRPEILKYRGVHDCSKNRYPGNPREGDLYICKVPNTEKMPNGKSYELSNYDF